MGPLQNKKMKHTKKNHYFLFPRQLFLYFLVFMSAASLKFENEVHLGHIWFSEAGFVQCFERREQFRRSVFFCGHLPPVHFL